MSYTPYLACMHRDCCGHFCAVEISSYISLIIPVHIVYVVHVSSSVEQISVRCTKIIILVFAFSNDNSRIKK